MRNFILSILLCALIPSSYLQAAQCEAYVGQVLPSIGFQLKLGDLIKISYRNENGMVQTGTVSFLGLARMIDGTNSGAFFFNAETMRIDYFGIDDIQFFDSAEERNLVPLERIAPIVRSINQQGGTCAAYAIYNCFRQLFEWGFIGNGKIVHHLADEASRNRFFVRINNDYYADGNHRGVERDVAAELGLQIRDLRNRDPQGLADDLRQLSEMGWPMLMRFDVDQAMSRTPYVIYNHETNSAADRRLWQPRPRGNSSSGGHQILLVRTFVDSTGKEWVLVVDSNWQAPRLWSIEQLNHLYSANLAGWVVWQDGPNPPDLPPPPVQAFDESSDIDPEGPITEPREF